MQKVEDDFHKLMGGNATQTNWERRKNGEVKATNYGITTASAAVEMLKVLEGPLPTNNEVREKVEKELHSFLIQWQLYL